jgi:pimeloyl-ACP methyl ester carboxylesterase
MWIDGPQRTPEMIAPAFRERVRAMNGALLLRDDVEGDEIKPDPLAAERLGEITVPTLIVYGDQDIADVQQADRSWRRRFLVRDSSSCQMLRICPRWSSRSASMRLCWGSCARRPSGVDLPIPPVL